MEQLWNRESNMLVTVCMCCCNYTEEQGIRTRCTREMLNAYTVIIRILRKLKKIIMVVTIRLDSPSKMRSFVA